MVSAAAGGVEYVTRTPRANWAGRLPVVGAIEASVRAAANLVDLRIRYLVWGNPRLTELVAGSGHRLVTTLPRV